MLLGYTSNMYFLQIFKAQVWLSCQLKMLICHILYVLKKLLGYIFVIFCSRRGLFLPYSMLLWYKRAKLSSEYIYYSNHVCLKVPDL